MIKHDRLTYDMQCTRPLLTTQAYSQILHAKLEFGAQVGKVDWRLKGVLAEGNLRDMRRCFKPALARFNALHIRGEGLRDSDHAIVIQGVPIHTCAQLVEFGAEEQRMANPDRAVEFVLAMRGGAS